MRLAFVVVATLATLFGVVSAATDPKLAEISVVSTPDIPDVARVLNVDIDGRNTRRFLRVESTIDADDEERALPSSLTKISEKFKPAADKIKPLANKLAPMAEKLTDKTMAIAVRLKPIADTFTGKLKPIADKLMPILKPIAAKLNTVPIVKRIIEKFKTFAEKIKNYKVGGHTISERYTMAKFENWFKQSKSPDDVKALLKVGEGATVNTKNRDLWTQYSTFYQWAVRDKEVKAAAVAAA